jgi:hypothetical protein
MKIDHTEQEFEQLRSSFETAYKAVGELHCPYLGEKIAFNSQGLEHLKFGRKNHARSRVDQAVRMQLFPLAPQVVQASRMVQGISQAQGFESFRSNGRTEIRMALREFREFVAILDNKRVRVVIKRVDAGPWYFWSIIPFWDSRTRKMSYGNPETD